MLTMFVYRAGEWGCSRGGWGQSMTDVECQSTEQGQDEGKADPEMYASFNSPHSSPGADRVRGPAYSQT